MEIFTRKYPDGTVVDSCLDPDRLDSLYGRIRDIHKKEFPDWTIPQMFKNLFHRYPDLAYEWVEFSDEALIAKLEEFAAALNAGRDALYKKYDIDNKEDKQCTENH